MKRERAMRSHRENVSLPVSQCMGGQKTAFKSWFIASAVYSGIELRNQACAASVVTRWAISYGHYLLDVSARGCWAGNKDEYRSTDRMLEETLSQQRQGGGHQGHTGHLQIEELEEDLGAFQDALVSSPCSSRTSLATDEEEREWRSVGLGWDAEYILDALWCPSAGLAISQCPGKRQVTEAAKA